MRAPDTLSDTDGQDRTTSRRKVLTLSAAGIAALAGCSGSSEDAETTTTATSTTEKPTAEFKIQELVVDETYRGEGKIEPQVSVENVGDKAGTTVLKFSLGDQKELVEKTVDSGSVSAASATFEGSNLDAGEYKLTVEAESSSVSKTIEVFQAPDSGFYGRLEAPVDISMADQYISLLGIKDGNREDSYSALSEDGDFSISHVFDPPYQALLSFSDQNLAEFDGLPPVVGLHEGEVTSDSEFVGTVELPQAYRTEVRLLDPNGEPVTNVEHVGIRDTSSGHGVYHERFTLTSEGYLKVKGASQTGVPAPKESSELEYQIELDPKADDEGNKLLGVIYGSEAGEEFEFTIEDPSQYK